jgi:hypothetical protein
VPRAIGRYRVVRGRGLKTNGGKEKASGILPEFFDAYSGMACGADKAEQKKPPAASTAPEGVRIRAVWKPSHTARLRARRRLHRSAPHCKGYCHTDRPTRKPWGFTLTTSFELCRTGSLLSRDSHRVLSWFPSAGAFPGEFTVRAGSILDKRPARRYQHP